MKDMLEDVEFEERGLRSELQVTDDECRASDMIPGGSLLAFLSRYFYERDIVQTRKTEWVVMHNGISMANTFDEMPITFKTKEDAVAWVYDNTICDNIAILKDYEQLTIICSYNNAYTGEGVIYSVCTLETENAHTRFVMEAAEVAASKLITDFLVDSPMPDYAARLIRFYFECLRENRLDRLTEINGADDAVPPKD